ncbi:MULTISPECIES: alpha/beta hydrolase [unclassified Pseudomonas]|uniref:alpha/beta hydrolase n=1 Tax=unclassified Pseudomonas TaxID=196821 RepID=UPI00244B677D|nr:MULTISPECIES: alpha/beta hydrolase [unclassified Pseudomonas]MDH0304913.1 alpha/beta hydrolase [Pseudomonas sp. GD04091]MDH1987878.1 alpha/beta hydrolase [Pseudomonas sp. GD03689]
MKPTTRTFSDAWRHLVFGLGLLLLGGCSSLLFYPEPGQPFTPEKARLQYQNLTLTAADGTRLHGWWIPVPQGVEVKGTVLHLHGNGGNLAWHLGGSYWLPKEGYQVLMIDYRGYGLSQGKPTLPEVYGDIGAALDWLDRAPPVQGKPLVLLGQSLGGAMAIHYLAQHPEQRRRFSALVFDGVPASYRAVGRYALSTSWMTWPLQVPLSWLVPDGDSAINSIERLENPPKLFFHSIDDNLVPLDNGLRLYRHAPPPRVLQLTRGDHVQTFADPTWRQVMLRFLDDPTHFNGLRRLAEVPNYPDEKNKQ